MESLNFSWLIEGEVSGHSAPLKDSDLAFLKAKGVGTLVRLAEASKVRVTPSQLEKHGFWDLHEPVRDFTAPTQSQIDKIITFMKDSVSKGRPVGVSCGAGIGRTGTILACYLVNNSFTPEGAMNEVKQKRGAGIETNEQREAVQTYYKRLHRSL